LLKKKKTRGIKTRELRGEGEEAATSPEGCCGKAEE